MEHCEYEINLFVDGELPSGNTKEVFLHIAECEYCSKYFSEILLVKEKSKGYFTKHFDRLKNEHPKKNYFYKLAFYFSAAASIVLLMITLFDRPEIKYISKNEVRVDTIFVAKGIPIARTKTQRDFSFTPGKKEQSAEPSLKSYLRYVMSLRTVEFTNANHKTNNGSEL